MSSIVVRQATAEDISTIVRFNAAMARETEGRELAEDILQQGVGAVLTDETKGLYFLAESDGRVVGQLLITYEWSDWRNGNFWWIQSVYVEEPYRGRGVFKSLFRYIEDLARHKPGVCGIRLYVEKTNTRAQKVYEQLGMHRSHYEMFELEF